MGCVFDNLLVFATLCHVLALIGLGIAGSLAVDDILDRDYCPEIVITLHRELFQVNPNSGIAMDAWLQVHASISCVLLIGYMFVYFRGADNKDMFGYWVTVFFHGLYIMSLLTGLQIAYEPYACKPPYMELFVQLVRIQFGFIILHMWCSLMFVLALHNDKKR